MKLSITLLACLSVLQVYGIAIKDQKPTSVYSALDATITGPGPEIVDGELDLDPETIKGIEVPENDLVNVTETDSLSRLRMAGGFAYTCNTYGLGDNKHYPNHFIANCLNTGGNKWLRLTVRDHSDDFIENLDGVLYCFNNRAWFVSDA
ncbi:hypothetical protein ACHAQA_004044 [Verticillium albo-atrum]